MRLYDDDGNLLRSPGILSVKVKASLILLATALTPLKKSEIDRILNQVEEAEGKEKPKIEYEIGEMVKVNEGPFANLVGKIKEIDPDRGS